MVVDVPVAVDALPALAPASDAASRALQARGWRVVTGLRMEASPGAGGSEAGFALWLVSPDGFAWAEVPVTDDGPMVQLVSVLDNGAAVVTGFEDDLYLLGSAWPAGGAYAETVEGDDLDALMAGHTAALAAASATEGAEPVAEDGVPGVILARRVWARLCIHGAVMAGLRSSLPAKTRATDPRWIAGHARVPIAALEQTPTLPCEVPGGFAAWQMNAVQAAPVVAPAAPAPVVVSPPAAPAAPGTVGTAGTSEAYFVALIDFEVRKKETAGEAWARLWAALGDDTLPVGLHAHASEPDGAAVAARLTKVIPALRPFVREGTVTNLGPAWAQRTWRGLRPIAWEPISAPAGWAQQLADGVPRRWAFDDVLLVAGPVPALGQPTQAWADGYERRLVGPFARVLSAGLASGRQARIALSVVLDAPPPAGQRPAFSAEVEAMLTALGPHQIQVERWGSPAWMADAAARIAAGQARLDAWAEGVDPATLPHALDPHPALGQAVTGSFVPVVRKALVAAGFKPHPSASSAGVMMTRPVGAAVVGVWVDRGPGGGGVDVRVTLQGPDGCFGWRPHPGNTWEDGALDDDGCRRAAVNIVALAQRFVAEVAPELGAVVGDGGGWFFPSRSALGMMARQVRRPARVVG